MSIDVVTLALAKSYTNSVALGSGAVQIPGPPGTAATVAVGTTTPGATPSVTNSGTANAAVLDFVLPAAQEGVTVGTALPPATPDPGELWSTVDGRLYIWNGAFWIQV